MDIYTIGLEDQLRILRRKAEPIKNIDESIVKLADNMITTMVEGNGLGLAGPQVGLLERKDKEYRLSNDGKNIADAYKSDPQGMDWVKLFATRRACSFQLHKKKMQLSRISFLKENLASFGITFLKKS